MVEIFERGSWLRGAISDCDLPQAALQKVRGSIELIELARHELRNGDRALALELLEEGLREPDQGTVEGGQQRTGAIEERYQDWLATRKRVAA